MSIRRTLLVALFALLSAPSGLLASPGGLLEAAPKIASYQLSARLDPKTHHLDGKARIRWRNATRHAAHELRFHLYLNAFRNTRSSMLRHDDGEAAEQLATGGWGWIDLSRLRQLDGTDLLAAAETIAPDDGNAEDATVLRVPLPQPVAPGETLELEVDFQAQLPFVAVRTGHKGDFHLVAQWFPKLGVLEADGTWNCPQFHTDSEFFADFGDYEASLTVPRGFVVGATGARIGTTPGPDGTVIHHYRQEGVHDFAWTTWPRFVERRRTFERPGFPRTEMILLLRPETERFAERHFAAVEHALSGFGSWLGPYPYPTITVVDPPWGARGAAGMEYPTLFAAGTRYLSPRATGDPEELILHEAGHQWAQGLLASDELAESFLDEGLTTYLTARLERRAYPGRVWTYRAFDVPLLFERVPLEPLLETSVRYFRMPTVDPIARTSWGYLDSPSYRARTYSKMALLLEQIERTIGAPAMERGLAAYGAELRFRHPRTRDLFDTLARAAGRDLSPLIRQLFADSGLLDYAVTVARSERTPSERGLEGPAPGTEIAAAGPGADFVSEVVVQRLGDVRLPVTVELRFADAPPRRLEWDGQERWVRYRITGPRLLAAVVDPDHVHVLDLDRLNNSRRSTADRRASRRWSQLARFWFQNLLESFATFA